MAAERESRGPGLKFRREEVISRIGEENPVPADIAECGECGDMAFVLFHILGQEHMHVQCVECGTSFCYGGRCE